MRSGLTDLSISTPQSSLSSSPVAPSPVCLRSPQSSSSSSLVHRRRLLLSTSSQVGCRVVFLTRHRRPTPPNNAAHPPIATSQGGTIHYITDISHGCAVAQGPSPPNAATRLEGAVRCPLQMTMRRCLALTPCPNNTEPPKLLG